VEETLVLAPLRDARDERRIENPLTRGVASLNHLATGFDGSAIGFLEPRLR
jgi:hypothetical protein